MIEVMPSKIYWNEIITNSRSLKNIMHLHIHDTANQLFPYKKVLFHREKTENLKSDIITKPMSNMFTDCKVFEIFRTQYE